MERATPNSSASSPVVWRPARHSSTRWASCLCLEFGLFAAEPSFGLGDFHALASAKAREVGLEFSDHREDVEQQSTDGVGGVVDGAADVELDAAVGEVFDDVAGLVTTNGAQPFRRDDPRAVLLHHSHGPDLPCPPGRRRELRTASQLERRIRASASANMPVQRRPGAPRPGRRTGAVPELGQQVEGGPEPGLTDAQRAEVAAHEKLIA